MILNYVSGENYIRWRKNVTLLYDFSKPVNSIPSRFTFLNDGMKIETVKVEDAGEYICEVVRPKPWSSLYLTHKVEVMCKS